LSYGTVAFKIATAKVRPFFEMTKYYGDFFDLRQ
jgi:hypothetical protein